MLKRFALLLAILLLCPLAAPADTYNPIYVDGQGGVLDGPPAYVTVAPGVLPPVVDTPAPEEEDPNAVPAWYYVSTPMTAMWNGEKVTVLSIGTAVSEIQCSQGKRQVSTRSLVFAEGVPANHQLATVLTESSGTVRLYKKASSKSTILYRVTAGSIVPVLSVGKSYTKIQYKDCIGYVRNSVLAFCDASAEIPQMAYIAYNDNTRSRNTIKVRQKASSSSRVVDELKCGLHATVLSSDGDWTEIEVNSLHCWIQSKYLTYPDPELEKTLSCYVPTAYSFAQAAAATPLPTAIVIHFSVDGAQ